MHRIDQEAAPTQPEPRRIYGPVTRGLRYSATLVLIPCPHGGGGPHCDSCELDCIVHRAGSVLSDEGGAS